MMYLVRTDNWIKEYSNLSQVEEALMTACAEWIADENYIGDKRYDTAEKLFNLAMEYRDFGDVAQVFEVHCASDAEDKPYWFDSCYPQDTFNMTRIL